MGPMLWIVQGLLAVVFTVSGIAKSTQDKARLLATGQTGVRDYPIGFIRFIAACELAGAAGLILPTALHIAPVLTPLAAIGLGIIMIGAGRAHAKLDEPKNVAVNGVLLALCVFVAIGRLS